MPIAEDGGPAPPAPARPPTRSAPLPSSGADALPAGFAPELRFLLRAYRAARDGGDLGALRADAGGLEWAKLIEGMALHGLLWLAGPLLAAGAVPAAEVEALRERAQAQALETLRRVQETVRIAAALEARGVRYLVVKGAPLSMQLHGEATRRAARDIDVLVEPAGRRAADEALASLGYPAADGVAAGTGAAVPTPKEVGYLHPRRRILVETHDRLTDTFELLPWNFEALWADRETASLGGQEICTLGRGRLPVYLCVHGAKHGWSRLLWLDDMAAALSGRQAIAQALAAAEPLGLRGVMLHAVGLTHAWLGRPTPAEALAEARASRQVRLLHGVARRIHADPDWWRTPPRRSWRRFWRGSVRQRLTAYYMKPRWSYWRRQLAHEFVSADDRRWLPLPAGLAWLYGPLRPFGWLLRRLPRPGRSR